MATMTPRRPWIDDPDWQPEMPSIDELDTGQVEFILDADADEFVALFYGRECRYSAHPINETTSVLIDPRTGETLGLMLQPFLRHALAHAPKALLAVPFATIIQDDDIREPDPLTEAAQDVHRPGVRERMAMVLEAVRGESHRSPQLDLRESLRILEGFVQPHGC